VPPAIHLDKGVGKIGDIISEKVIVFDVILLIRISPRLAGVLHVHKQLTIRNIPIFRQIILNNFAMLEYTLSAYHPE